MSCLKAFESDQISSLLLKLKLWKHSSDSLCTCRVMLHNVVVSIVVVQHVAFTTRNICVYISRFVCAPIMSLFFACTARSISDAFIARNAPIASNSRSNYNAFVVVVAAAAALKMIEMIIKTIRSARIRVRAAECHNDGLFGTYYICYTMDSS